MGKETQKTSKISIFFKMRPKKKKKSSEN